MDPPCVVVVPGVAGSLLYDVAAPPAYSVVWLSQLRVLLGELAYLRLGTTAAPLPSTFPVLKPSDPLTSVYGTVMDYLRGQGWAVSGYGYDWRGELVHQGGLLSVYLRRLRRLFDAPLRVLCHSMGGLVMRAAWRALGDDAPQVVQRVVTLGVPDFGSYDTLAVMLGVGPSFRRLALLFGGYHRSVNPPAPPGADYLWAVTDTLPSLYTLLPFAADGPAAADPLTARIYQVGTYFPYGHLGVERDLFEQAKASQLLLRGAYDPQRWVQVQGYGVQTPVGVVELSGPLGLGMLWSKDGDGSVGVVQGSLPGVPTVLTPTSHGALVYDPRVLRRLPGLLMDATVAPSSQIEGDVLE